MESIVLRLLRSVFALLVAAGSASVADYTIKKGDTFYGIAKNNSAFDVSQLVDANPGIDPRRLQIGQTIQFPGSGPREPLTPKTPGPKQSFIDRLNTNEGFKNQGYLDTKNNVTIGYGSTRNKRVDKILRDRGYNPDQVFRVGGQAITRQVADLLRDSELSRNEKRLMERLSFYRDAPPRAKIVLQDMAYNMGSEFNFPKMFKAMGRGDYREAAAELMDSKYARTDVPNRARRNRDLLMELVRE